MPGRDGVLDGSVSARAGGSTAVTATRGATIEEARPPGQRRHGDECAHGDRGQKRQHIRNQQVTDQSDHHEGG